MTISKHAHNGCKPALNPVGHDWGPLKHKVMPDHML